MALAIGFSANAAEDQSSPPGNRVIRYFGDYELQEEIARGGMGVVYRARQVSLNRSVALKMILAGHLATPSSMQRFQTEAEAAARLDHPNVVPIYEIGQHDGQHYFSMKLIEGGTLADRMPNDEYRMSNERSAKRRRAEFDTRHSAFIISKVARAVHYAHQRGILHRDLKPTNILIDEDGEPHVTDFGLAKLIESDAGLSKSGAILGTPSYMAPEQAAGHITGLTIAADTYSLGAILYELLAGQPPFVANTPLETLRKVVEEEPIPPSVVRKRGNKQSFQSQIDRDLETICLKCLRKDPKARYGSAEMLADDLERWRNGEPILACPANAPEKLWRWCKRKPAIATSIATIATLITLVAMISTTAAVRLKREQSNTREKLYASYLAQARANRLSGRPGRYFDTMETIAKAAAIRPSLELRNEAIAALAVVDLRMTVVGEMNSPDAEYISFDPTLQRYAQVTPNGDISVRQVGDKKELELIPTRQAGVRWLHGFTADGRWLAYHTTGAGHCVWDLKRHELAIQKWNGGVVLSPTGEFAATMKHNGSLLIRWLESGEETRRQTKASPGALAKTLDPSGSRLACFHPRTFLVEIVDLQSGDVKASMKAPNNCDQLAWSSDGQRLAASCNDHRAYIWDASSGELLQTCVGHNGEVRRVAFNQAGNFLASAGHDGTVRLWDPFTGAQILRLPSAGTYQLQFSPDDRQLGFMAQGKSFGLLEVNAHPEYRCFASRQSGRAERVSISPDGRIVAATWNGVMLWDFATGKTMGFLPQIGCLSALFDSDGKNLITSGLAGLVRWPIRAIENTAADELRIGSNSELYHGAGPLLGSASMSADNRRIAFTHYNRRDRGRVIDLANPTNIIELGDHSGAHYVAISPDGRWVATGTWHGSGVKVWQVETELPPPASATVLFSPNGRWLLTASLEYQLWDTESWQPGPPLPSEAANTLLQAMAFSPDSQWLAIAHGGRAIRLLETQTARVLADFEAPAVSEVAGLCFSQNGEKLLASDGNGQVHVWNLPLIRQRLARLKLDWAAYPPRTAGATASHAP
jgi:eukaryotic-like serine/threonine-protein kinase